MRRGERARAGGRARVAARRVHPRGLPGAWVMTRRVSGGRGAAAAAAAAADVSSVAGRVSAEVG